MGKKSILNRARLASSGADQKNWYKDTNLLLKRFYPDHWEIMAGFLASTSINAAVKPNLTMAKKAYNQFTNDQPFSGYLGIVKINLNRTISNQSLTGLKIENFRLALLGNPNAIVIDRWMLKAFEIHHKNSPTKKEYCQLSEQLRIEAQSYGVSPAQFQAMVWCGIKRKNDTVRFTEKNFGQLLAYSGHQLILPI